MVKTKNKNSRASSKKGISAHGHSWILALIIILIIVAVVAIVILVIKPQPDKVDNPSTPAVSQPEESLTPDSDPIIETPDSPESPEKTPQYEGEDPNDLEELTGIITYKGVENGNLTIMATINQYLSQSGTCIITLTGRNSRDTYTASVAAHADITASYCENFEIPTANLLSDTYDIEIKLNGDGKTGTIRDEVKL